jgi:hypothetical protein
MLGPNDPLNPDIPDPDADLPATPPADESDEDIGEPEARDPAPAEPPDRSP